jgi:stearoyl-CoA desaturase (Delta-9 desaturase)
MDQFTSLLRSGFSSVVRWFDADFDTKNYQAVRRQPDKVDWVRTIPFILLHLGCFLVLLVGWSWFAVGLAVMLYLTRMFAITGFYHRYFSHRTFQTSRFGQLILAVWGSAAIQRGPLWWAYQHRHHHRHSDEPEDVHSPKQHGFIWSHIGWITSARNFPTDYSKVRDLVKFPELVFLNRFDVVVPAFYGVGLYLLGAALERWAPGLGTTAWQVFVWGFFVSTTFLFHGTSCINSLAHLMGRKRYETKDDSRNSWVLALITLGEGWHNNHHHYMNSTRQGFYWWELDLTYYGLKVLSWTGLIWGLRPVPRAVLHEVSGSHPVEVEMEPEATEPAPAVPFSAAVEKIEAEANCH